MFKNDQRGFTLLELTVVIAIIILLSGLVLTNYQVGEREYALLRSAYKLAQDLRTAEKMAMASETLPASFGGGFPKGGYGIFFQNNLNFYILFADCDGDKEYDASGAALSCADATPGTPYPEKIKEIFLEEKIKISSLYPGSPLNITFFPPDPTIKIKYGSSYYDSAVITITYDGKTKTVKVNTVGLIEID
jgi:prepilin-type N-terminal cleavage/methylation domain-containing protein